MERPPGIDAELKEQNQENIVYRDRYTVVNLNKMVFFTSSCNAKTENNAEGLLKKRAATHIQRKNCENKNTGKKKLPELIGGWGYYWGYGD